MAIETLNQGISPNATEISGQIIKTVINNLPPAVVQGAKVLGIVVIVYIVFLIIRTFFQIRSARKIRKMAENIEEIKKKVDILFKERKKK
jgi:beta-lactamase regulating signal transducer with metallopeptidase domain